MKTITTSIFSLILALLMSYATTAGNINPDPNPKSDLNLTIDSDSLRTVSRPVTSISKEKEKIVNISPLPKRVAGTGLLVATTNEQEPYVDDIPFETASIASRYLPVILLGIYTQPEQYIDDIPFSTERIAKWFLSMGTGKYCCTASEN